MKPTYTGNKDEFIKANLPLVRSIANRFTARANANGIDWDDIFSTGCVGLMKAYNRFDPDRGFQFSTYAVSLIIGEIQRFFREHRPIWVSRSERQLATQIRSAGLENESAAAIADHFGCGAELAKRTLCSMALKIVSMDRPIIDGRRGKAVTVEDTIPFDEDFTSVHVNAYLDSLSDRERMVVESRLLGLTQKQIGKRIGTGQAQVCRILRKLARQLEAV